MNVEKDTAYTRYIIEVCLVLFKQIQIKVCMVWRSFRCMTLIMNVCREASNMLNYSPEFPTCRGKQNRAVTELCNVNRDKQFIQMLGSSLSMHMDTCFCVSVFKSVKNVNSKDFCLLLSIYYLIYNLHTSLTLHVSTLLLIQFIRSSQFVGMEFNFVKKKPV